MNPDQDTQNQVEENQGHEKQVEQKTALTVAEQQKLAQDRAHARQVFAHKPEFFKSVFNLADLPEDDIAEIAFAGRSNVGKSSVINFIFQQKGMARSSSTPGRTQSLNFFKMGNFLNVVDMPGYGYAKAPKTMVDAWNQMLRRYLLGRAQLKRVFVMIDARHGLKANDVEILDMLDEAAVSYQIILTKIDKIKPPQVKTRIAEIEAVFNKHPALHPEILASSSEKQLGLEALQIAVAHVVDLKV